MQQTTFVAFNQKAWAVPLLFLVYFLMILLLLKIFLHLYTNIFVKTLINADFKLN